MLSGGKYPRFFENTRKLRLQKASVCVNIKNPRCRWQDMVVSDVSMLDVPPLRGNPFDSRPIERSRAHEIVGMEEVLITWKEHMHSQSPRMLLLVGERGSGRTSLINAISSQTTKHFVGYYWHKEDPLNRALNEIAVTFCGHEVPPTMHQKVERIVETLDSDTGPLPLIAFDYPAEVDISPFLTLILPILQRLRALVVVSLSNSQLLSLEEGVKEAFDEPDNIEPFTTKQIQDLCDARIRRMAREKWTIRPELLDSIRSRTGGNARSVVTILRDLIDEKRGLGSHGTLEGLTSWDSQKATIPEQSEPNREEFEDSPSGKQPTSRIFPPQNEQEESLGGDQEESVSQIETPVDEDDWDQEPDDMWDEEEETPLDEPDEENQPKDPARITDWTVEDGTILTIEEGTEPPIRPQSPKGFTGLVSRSKITNDEMPSGPDYSTPIQEPETPASPIKRLPRENSVPKPNLDLSETPIKSVSTEPEPPEEKRVFHSEGELWTVDSELEETLPEPSDSEENETPEPSSAEDFDPPLTPSEPPTIIPGPIWESESTLEEGHLRSMSEAERLVVSIASQREISPSDAEIQARLEVGRPRLSQIYNSLQKSGILSVRKEGRSRLFKLSVAASDFLQEA